MHAGTLLLAATVALAFADPDECTHKCYEESNVRKDSETAAKAERIISCVKDGGQTVKECIVNALGTIFALFGEGYEVASVAICYARHCRVG
ncbi:hypothetical protein Q1695_000693 [Nippostrongylus brasiliensis]|nr:hypothetical protein Q1695_000693 [Nippostrongylus brasiliensis]